jgi:hypothetical protein
VPTKADIIAAIQAVVDATEEPHLMMSLGTPGSYVEDAAENQRPTGAGWAVPGAWDSIAGGIADWLDSKYVGAAPGFRSIQNMAVSGQVAAGVDLVQFTDTLLVGTLPRANSVAPGTQLVLKAVPTGPLGSQAAPDGGDTIDDGGAVVIPGGTSLRLYSDGISDWRTW